MAKRKMPKDELLGKGTATQSSPTSNDSMRTFGKLVTTLAGVQKAVAPSPQASAGSGTTQSIPRSTTKPQRRKFEGRR